VHGFIVDWERNGKAARQAGANTEINGHTVADLRRVRAATDALVVCRINGPGATTGEEIELAIDAGADELLLPMVRWPDEVETVLRQVDGRCGVGILIETVTAVAQVEDFAHLPLSRVYVGLNDLAIERRSPTIFDAVCDGTVERLRHCFTVPFGFAGLTLPEAGSPIPCRLLIGEMIRLGCAFSFLRRSFHRDMRGRELCVEIPRLIEALREARGRDARQVACDQIALATAIRSWPATAAGAGVLSGA
jgi:hypothetical protein